MSIQILLGDCRQVLKTLADRSVHCAVTSPPYFGLRDYGTASWAGGDAACDHVVGEIRTGAGMAALGEKYAGGGKKAAKPKPMTAKHVCPKCGAQRADNQIGLELTPEKYVEQIVEVMREVRRVMADDGTLWLNLGDSYAGGGNGGHQRQGPPGELSTLEGNRDRKTPSFHGHKDRGIADRTGIVRKPPAGLKQKDLIGIPWRIAFALQADSWYLRQDIIWSKPNPMPESVTDRCTKAHEYIFLLSKSDRYYFDAQAIAEDAIYADSGRSSAAPEDLDPNRKRNDRVVGASFRAITQKRNKRSVWSVATRPFTEAHFATFPPALIEPCILAGTSERGHCPACGTRWVRVVAKKRSKARKAGKNFMRGAGSTNAPNRRANRKGREFQDVETVMLGFRPVCRCYDDLYRLLPRPRKARKREQRDAWPGRFQRLILRPGLDHWVTAPDIVIDPFGGAGTTGLVADQNGRAAIMIELNSEYAAMAKKRISTDAGLFSNVY